MIKQGTPTQIQPNGFYESQYGTLYKYNIAFDNGDSGEYSSKSQNQTYFQVGQTRHYSIMQTQWGHKIKPEESPEQSAPAPNASAPKQDKGWRIEAQTCLKAAVELCVAGKIGTDDIELKTRELLEILKGIENPSEPQIVVDEKDILGKKDIVPPNHAKNQLPF